MADTPSIVLWPTSADGGLVERRLRSIPGIRVQSVADAAALEGALVDAHALLIATPHLNDAVLAAVRRAPSLRWIQLLNAGLESLPPDAFRETQIVCNAGGALAPTVAEHALALLLALLRKLDIYVPAAAHRTWDKAPKSQMRTLAGSTLVIVGFGAIGSALAQRARAFDCRIVAVTRTSDDRKLADLTYSIERLNEALAIADHIAVCLPLTDFTRGLFDTQRFASCARQPTFVNVSRGAIVDTSALVRALTVGRLAGAGLDVVDPEPLPETHALWSAPNVVITPHVAAGGGYGLLAEFVASNVQRFVRDEALLSRVSFGAVAVPHSGATR